MALHSHNGVLHIGFMRTSFALHAMFMKKGHNESCMKTVQTLNEHPSSCFIHETNFSSFSATALLFMFKPKMNAKCTLHECKVYHSREAPAGPMNA